jgi:hypothetical protein
MKNTGQKQLTVKDFSTVTHSVPVGGTIKIKPSPWTYYVVYTDSLGTAITISTMNYPGDSSFAVYAGNAVPDTEFSLAVSMDET